MKKSGKKILGLTAMALCAVTLFTVTGLPAAAESGIKSDAAALQESLSSGEALDADKDETVYVIADADGTPTKVVVSEWLKNKDGADTLDDYSELTDITNTSGDETFTADGNNCVWNAGGSEIHYNGTTDKDLPVSVSVRYYLDGTETSPADMAGRSGHVTIRFDYANTAVTTAEIDGETRDIHVPFLMASGLILDDDAFTNVTVSSGTVVNDGTRDIIVGYGMPGLAESLGLDDDAILTIPESVTVEADTTAFAMSDTITVAMAGLFGNVQFDKDGKLSALSGDMDTLDSAASQLVDGTAALSTGLAELYASCGTLQAGADSLNTGAQSLEAGAQSVSDGAAALSGGLSRLSGSSAALVSGAGQIVDAVFESATTALRAQLVSSGAMTEAEAAAVTLTPAAYSDVFAQLTGAAKASAETQLRAPLAAAGLTADQQDLALTLAFDLMSADSSLTVSAAVTKAAALMGEAAQVQTACAVISDQWLADAQIQAYLAQIVSATGTDTATAAKLAAVTLALAPTAPASQLEAASALLKDAATVAAEAADTDKIGSLCVTAAMSGSDTYAALTQAKAQLDSVIAFYSGLQTYTAGVDSAGTGATQLSDGAAQLTAGAAQLSDGTGQLCDGTAALTAGVAQLKDGAATLESGMSAFYTDGISRLIGSFSGDYAALYSRLQAVAEAGQSYRSFGGIADGMTGSTKFIFKTAAIG